MMDKQENDMRQALAHSEAVAVQREGNALALTFKSDFTFDVNSSSIRPGLYSELDRVAQVLSAYPQTTILIAGHTDSTGSDAYNQQLSERRAQSVKNALVQRGIAAGRVHAVGYGEALPSPTTARNTAVSRTAASKCASIRCSSKNGSRQLDVSASSCRMRLFHKAERSPGRSTPIFFPALCASAARRSAKLSFPASWFPALP